MVRELLVQSAEAHERRVRPAARVVREERYVALGAAVDELVFAALRGRGDGEWLALVDSGERC